MKREDILSKMFDAEFCEPKDKAVQERELEEMFLKACAQTNKPLYVLKPALISAFSFQLSAFSFQLLYRSPSISHLPSPISDVSPVVTVFFHEPPAPQKVGGLELAVRSLEAYLLASGIPVKSEAEFAAQSGNVPDAVVHFHGLWQPQFLRASRRCRARRIPYVVSPH